MAGKWRFVVVALVAFGLVTPHGVQARMVSTETVLEQPERARVMALLEREDVQRQMQELGIPPEEAKARVAALSDEEIRHIAGQLDQMPAGGDGLGVVIGAAVLIFVILLITDIAGLTKVFPWTRSVR